MQLITNLNQKEQVFVKNIFLRCLNTVGIIDYQKLFENQNLEKESTAVQQWFE